jgi:hypothetical protein
METCHYRNDSPQLVLLRCMASCGFFLEKVIFPWEDWCFECPSGSRTEIWTYGVAGVELLHAMDSEELRLPIPSDPERRLVQAQSAHASLSGRDLQGSPGQAPSPGIAARC